MSNLKNKHSSSFLERISDLLKQSRASVLQYVNTTMVVTYFEIGKIIVEEEQNGKERAEYGKKVLKEVSKRLSSEFGRGFSVSNLQQMKKFFLTYEKQQTLSVKSETVSRISKNQFNLSWSHYLVLIKIENIEERNFYEIEAFKNQWSLRELKRQSNTALYERLVLSKDEKAVLKLSKEGQILETPKDAVKDPYILEFIGLEDQVKYSETELEQEIINNLEHFLLELGKGYTFVGRQVRFTFDEKHFRVDLVFYNRILQCFVLLDLKIGEITHQDLGQMQMYVNHYDRNVKLKTENKTIGIVLCKQKNESLVKLTLPENNKQIFASKYEMILPSKEDLKRIIEKK